jgi:hypothetical protein
MVRRFEEISFLFDKSDFTSEEYIRFSAHEEAYMDVAICYLVLLEEFCGRLSKISTISVRIQSYGRIFL